MKILLVSSSSSGGGGGELFFLKLAKRYIAGGHDVSIIYSKDISVDSLVETADDLGCHVRRIDYLRVYDRPLRSLSLFFSRLITFPGVDFSDFDVVHVSQQNVEDGIDLVDALSRICPDKLVLTIHIVDFLSKFGQRFGAVRQIYSSSVYRRIASTARFSFVCNSAKADFVSIFGFAPRFSHVVHNGAEVPDLIFSRAESRRKLGISCSGLLVGTLGRFESQKNQKSLLIGFSKFFREHPTSKLMLIGDGSLRGELESLVVGLGLSESVLITGWVSDPYMYLSALDVFVLPSNYEGFPFALVEALLMKKFCIASAIPPHVECLLGSASLLFDPDDTDRLAQILAAFERGEKLLLSDARSAIDVGGRIYRFDGMVQSMLELYSRRGSYAVIGKEF